MECSNRDRFCFICSLYTTHNHKDNITETVIFKYAKRFQVSFIRKKWWTPTKWLPRENHDPETCYFCTNVTETSGVNFDKRHLIKYIRSELVKSPRNETQQREEDPDQLEEADQDQDEDGGDEDEGDEVKGQFSVT